MADADRDRARADQRASNRGQAAADRERAAADRDQIATGRDDQARTQVDQLAASGTANREQSASDRDRAAADRELAGADREETEADRASATHAALEYALNALEVQHDALDTLVIELATCRQAFVKHAATLAHEVRTPLHAILGLTQGLLAEPGAVGGEPGLDLRVIDEAAAQALELVNQQLALCTLDAGRAVVRLDDVSVPLLLSALKAMMEPLRPTASVEFVVETAPDLPTLRTDPGKVAQILRNLASNALRHTESGEVRVSAALADDGRLIEFVVHDTGPGLRPEDRSRIFEDYEQVDAPAPGSGSGLGLPLAARLARLLGGDITLEPTVAGACFKAAVAVTFDPDTAGPGVELLSRRQPWTTERVKCELGAPEVALPGR